MLPSTDKSFLYIRTGVLSSSMNRSHTDSCFHPRSELFPFTKHDDVFNFFLNGFYQQSATIPPANAPTDSSIFLELNSDFFYFIQGAHFFHMHHFLTSNTSAHIFLPYFPTHDFRLRPFTESIRNSQLHTKTLVPLSNQVFL